MNHSPSARPISATTIRRRLRALGNASRAIVLRRFFKTAPGQYGAGDRFRGINVPTLRSLAREYRALPLNQVAQLLSSPWHEDRLLALLVLVRQYRRGTVRQRGLIFRLYMRNTDRINNWDLVDCSAEHIVGAQLRGDGFSTMLRLARSRVLWERRIAIIATFDHIKHREFGATFAVARVLLEDSHDLIHKAVGWKLREVGKRNRALAQSFLSRYLKRMQRTRLRYAIERYPGQLRRRSLAA
jgi:3-methyladenine DNA glycosylase AlkD